MNEGVSVDYQHSQTGITALIAATCRGMSTFVETLLQMGASISLQTPLNNWDALQWAKHFKNQDVIEVLEAYWTSREETRADFQKMASQQEISAENKQLLDWYHTTFNDEEVDIELILDIIFFIISNSHETPKGAILIFLPGYDEIVSLRENILADLDRFDSNKYVLYTLHSQMNSGDQRRVFRKVPHDVRKIILSTNIAETSVTIDDVVFVIDAGKVKEKSFDSTLDVSMLKSVWISQASAIQRRGRAGRCRPGVCYHLYSSYRYNHMQKFQVPEILRMPIHELCLQVKLLSPNTSVAEFLSKCPDPPSPASLRNSINLLKVRSLVVFITLESNLYSCRQLTPSIRWNILPKWVCICLICLSSRTLER